MLRHNRGKRAAKPVDCPRDTLLCRQVVAFVLVSLFVTGCARTVLVGRDHPYPKADWKTELQYDDDEIKPLSMSLTGVPQVEVQLNGKPFHLKYDFGCSKGFLITTAIKHRADYVVLKETNTYEADGTFRGKVRRIRVDSLEVFGNRFENQEGTLADWRIYSSLPYEGLIGLEYFADYRFTLDYRRRKLGLTRKPLPDAVRESNKYEFIELLDPPDYHKYGVYAPGEVNGVKCVVHIDTGCSKTTLDPAILTAGQKAKHRGNRCSAESAVSLGGFEFAIKDFRVAQIRHPSPSQHPVRMGIGSDLLKDLMITIDRTENRNVLIIHK